MHICNKKFNDFWTSLPDSTSLVLQPKINGDEIILQYKSGELTKINSIRVKHLNKSLKSVHNIPKRINSFIVKEIKGKLYTTEFHSISHKDISLQSFKYHRNLRFCPFQIFDINGEIDLDETDTLALLSNWGFDIPSSMKIQDPKDFHKFYKDWIKGNLFNEYPTDGIILKINSRKLHQKGLTRHVLILE